MSKIILDPKELWEASQHFRCESESIHQTLGNLRNAVLGLDVLSWTLSENVQIAPKFAQAEVDGRFRVGKRGQLGNKLARVVETFEQTDRQAVEELMGLPSQKVLMILTIPGLVEQVNPRDLAVFLSQWEDDLPDEAKAVYLTEPHLLEMELALQEQIIENWRNGDAPLTAQGLYEMAMELAGGDPGTALLICHNVTKSFARGGTAIYWQRVGDANLDEIRDIEGAEKIFFSDMAYQFYTDGKHVYPIEQLHKDGVPECWDRPSAFYLMFSVDEFGTDDPGDWYHFFSTATVSYYGASGRTDGEGLLYSGSLSGAPFKSQEYADVLSRTIEDVAGQMQDPDIPASDAYEGWRWANTISFLEGGVYGITQGDVNWESMIHMRGAVFGLEQAGVVIPEEWEWRVPTVSSIEPPGASDFIFGGDDVKIEISVSDLTSDTYDPTNPPTVEPPSYDEIKISSDGERK